MNNTLWETTPFGEYPKVCSWCRHFRAPTYDNNTNIPVLDYSKSFCKIKSRGQISGPLVYLFSNVGINPSEDIPKDCEQFSLLDYYYCP